MNKSFQMAAYVAVSIMVSASSCGRGSNQNVKIEGVVGPNVSFVDNKFTLTMVLLNVPVDAGLRLPVPRMPNSYLEIGPDFQSNGMLVGIGVDANDLLELLKNPASTLDPTRLPGGRALPGVAAGELPGFAVQVPRWENVAFYVSKSVFGVFVPVNLPWKDYMGTFRFFDAAGERIGNLTIVGNDANDRNSGVLLLIDMSGKVAKLAGVR